MYHIEIPLVDFRNERANEVSNSDPSDSKRREAPRRQIDRLEGVFETLDVGSQEQERPTMEGVRFEHDSASDVRDAQIRVTVDLGIELEIGISCFVKNAGSSPRDHEPRNARATRPQTRPPPDVIDPLETAQEKAEEAFY